MQIKKITSFLEALSPLAYQESYDNSGLLVGNPIAEVENVLISLDVTEEVVEEAIQKNCQLIISHHPIIFSGLKSITGKNYVERTVAMAIKHDIALYAIHTNLDNVQHGVNSKIGEILGVINPKILDPKKGLLKKLVVFTPPANVEEVSKALFEAGAGNIGNYDQCSYQSLGRGSFRAGDKANPHIGKIGQRHYEEEVKIEVLVSIDKIGSVLGAMFKAHPYEEIAYDLFGIDNIHPNIGAGMIGDLPSEMDTMEFLKHVKTRMKAPSLRYTDLLKKKVKKIAWCGGSGSFLLNKAKMAGADIFITSDFKYHQFFGSENQIVIADIGHFENEQYTKELLADKLKKNFSSFAVLLADTNTNPINYL